MGLRVRPTIKKLDGPRILAHQSSGIKQAFDTREKNRISKSGSEFF